MRCIHKPLNVGFSRDRIRHSVRSDHHLSIGYTALKPANTKLFKIFLGDYGYSVYREGEVGLTLDQSVTNPGLWNFSYFGK